MNEPMNLEEELKSWDPNVFDMEIRTLVDKTKLIKSEARILNNEISTLRHNIKNIESAISEYETKIRLNKNIPYLVGNVIEIFEDGSGVVQTSTRISSYLPMIGLVPPEQLRPGDLVALHKDSNVVFEKLPTNYDVKVKSMELDEKPSETYEDIGGLERQIEELNEAIVLPLTHPERFKALGIKPPKGVLMYGPPGTGKTLMARACAARTNATFLKLAGPQLVQMYIGDGARLVRDAFALAKEKKPTIIFIDEIDAIGTKRVDADRTGDREVQRTMLELLNELDGFSVEDQVKIICATNRVDILDPALLRSGRIDRKIEFPLPNLEGRKRILQIHASKMNIGDINFDEIARSTEGFNGAQCKAVCTEAGMCALRKNSENISQGDFLDGIQEVLSKKKFDTVYFT